MEHRLGRMSDINAIMQIVDQAKKFLAESGVSQWQSGYPNEENFAQDINEGICHVFFEDERLVGVIAISFAGDELYSGIENGSWLSGDAPYAVVHRSAVDENCRGRGIAYEMLSFAENIAAEQGIKSVRIDTHQDNKPMRTLLKKRGYVPCGTIYMEHLRTENNLRICYEKLI
ncbi:MAG: GNAT family N-acetyltransferase [Oscillospiraceae bacterium]